MPRAGSFAATGGATNHDVAVRQYASDISPDTSAPKPTEKASAEKPPRPLTSQDVKIQIVQKLLSAPGLDSTAIDVKVSNDKVVLKGSVPTADQKILVEQVAKSAGGNRRIENRLSVAALKNGAAK